jgi:hypothetical protein
MILNIFFNKNNQIIQRKQKKLSKRDELIKILSKNTIF